MKFSSVGNPQVRSHTLLVYSKDGNTSVCSFPVRNEGKCLGYLWRSKLSSIGMVEECIHKARRTFFQFGSMSAFKGYLSPVSTSSLLECCVYPVMLYDIENWILCATFLQNLRLSGREDPEASRIVFKHCCQDCPRMALGALHLHH